MGRLDAGPERTLPKWRAAEGGVYEDLSGGGRAMSSAKRTRDHDEIRRWAESRGGIPTFVKGTGDGLLRIDFIEGKKSGGREENLDETTWDEWFEVFDDRGLEFLHVPEGESRFFKLVYPGDDD
jgi:hypothetical protein